MRKPFKKIFYQELKFSQLIDGAVNQDITIPKALKVTARSSAITKPLIGQVICIHTGHSYVNLIATKEHLGYKLGEFSLTRKKKALY